MAKSFKADEIKCSIKQGRKRNTSAAMFIKILSQSRKLFVTFALNIVLKDKSFVLKQILLEVDDTWIINYTFSMCNWLSNSSKSYKKFKNLT